MKTPVRFVLAALAAGVSAVASATTYRLVNSGSLELGDGLSLRVTAYAKNWAGVSPAAKGFAAVDERTGRARWQLAAGSDKYGTGTTTVLPLADGRTYVRMAVEMLRDFPTEGLVCTLNVPDHLAVGGKFGDGHGTEGVFPASLDRLFVYSGCPGPFAFELPKLRRKLTIDFAEDTYLAVQDDRKWAKSFTLRIHLKGGGVLKAGKTYETAFAVGGEKAELKYATAHAIRAGEDWLPLDYRKEVVAGSAADFSHFPFRDGPAGKYGWLKAKDGHFVFADRPDAPQRFWGVNFCGESTCPSHADAERIVTFLTRAGYNTMRIHHYERTLVKGSSDRLTPNPESLDNFDYFFAKAKAAGIYTTTDVYVSRNVAWRDVGFDRDGFVDMSVVKGLFLVHEPAFENWKAFARNLFTHVNPYTGLRYADDPAMPFVSLVNEGVFAWRRGIFDLEPTRTAWKAWLAAERARDPKAYPKAPADCLGATIDNAKLAWEQGLMAFMSDCEARFAVRARDYLRSLGVKALLTDWNCGPYPVASAITNTLDYVDMHFYVDHPEFLGERWALPVRMGNSNPDRARGAMGLWTGKIAHQAKMPYTISEWNFTAPNACRGAAGLLTGACTALLDWDAMWRFDYIGRGSDLDDGTTGLGYFGIVGDPFKTASERAGVLLYRRRELKPLDIRPDGDYRFPLPVEKGTGRFTVVTDFTAGGFGLAGDAVTAGPFACRLGRSHAAIWASAVDAKPLVSSDRILLTHLTDLKTDGIRFMDETCQVLQNWGSKSLIVRRGTAEVALRLAEPGAYEVWALATNGARQEKLASRVADGKLAFTADVRAADGKARYLYEIARRK